MKVGDDVLYVPDKCHATVPDAKGQYPWVFGSTDRNGNVEEMSDSKLRSLLKVLKRQKGSLVREGLELIRPKQLWPAVVTEVSADGKSVSLDVDAPNSAVTLHVTVPIDPTGKASHSCHAISTDAQEEEDTELAPTKLVVEGEE